MSGIVKKIALSIVLYLFIGINTYGSSHIWGVNCLIKVVVESEIQLDLRVEEPFCLGGIVIKHLLNMIRELSEEVEGQSEIVGPDDWLSKRNGF